MLGRITQLLGVVVAVAAVTFAARAAEIACSSQVGGYQFCRTPTAGGVKLIEQLTPHSCNQDNTWGYDQGGVWVSNGCSARFQIGPDAKPSDDIREKAQAGGASAIARSLTGEARDGERKRAAKPSDSGPAAAPVVQDATPAPSASAPSAPAPQALMKQAAPPTATAARSALPAKEKPTTAPSVLVCQSRDYKLEKCPVPVTAYVELRKKLGRAECRFSVTWGYDYGQIWVAQGCRAEFAVY